MEKFPREITLSRHSGEEKQFVIRKCVETDLYDILKLQRKIYDDLSDPGQYALVDEEDILESLKQDFCLGVYQDASERPKKMDWGAFFSGLRSDSENTKGKGPHLVAFSMMIVNRVSRRNYGTLVGYTPEQQKKCVSMEITIVDGPQRGFGMQHLFVKLREEAAREMGATEAMVTIGPENKYSLNNLQKAGYEIIDTRVLYEGAERHILRKKL